MRPGDRTTWLHELRDSGRYGGFVPAEIVLAGLADIERRSQMK